MTFYADTLNTIVCAVISLQLVANLASMPRLNSQSDSRGSHSVARNQEVLVSVLIPARNEASVIADCLRAVQAQTHSNIEILVLNDNSTDNTASIVSDIRDERIRLIPGAPLPDRWTGKNWACHQLSQHAKADVFLFVDADTVLEPHAIDSALSAITEHDAGLVSALTSSQYQSRADVALLPMINFGLMSLFPVWLMHTRFFYKVSVAMGPFLMVTRAAYTAAGGHEVAPTEVVDDVMLSRRVKAAKYPVRLCNGTEVAATTWYGTFRGTWHGFTKNAFGAMESSISLALITLLVVIPCLGLPFFRLAWGLYHWNIPVVVVLQVGLLIAGRTLTAIVGKDPIRGIALHPIATVFWGATLVWSALLTLSHRSVQWRDREVRLSSN
jgi:chlorobactene glucosyltransferase